MLSTKIKIASWNIEGRLSNPMPSGRGNATQIINNIRIINADILVLLEAHTEKSLEDLAVLQAIQNLGYKIYDVPYDDDLALRTDTYTMRLSMLLLSKRPIKDFKIIKLGDFRNCISTSVETSKNQYLRIFGVHLDDRKEATRLRQINDLSKIVNQSKMPTIVVGDFNAMHGEDLWPAKLLKTKISRLISHIILPNLYTKVIEMAQGEALKRLEDATGLTDIDKSHRPTTTPKIRGYEMLPSIRLIQIDHMFISKDVKADKLVISADGGSDHRAISTELFLN